MTMNRVVRLVALVLLVTVTAAFDAGYGIRQVSTFSNPVMPGDFPDPSVIRVGTDYWATATTSQWAPIFPLLHSTDLVNWRMAGAVFQAPPAWSAGSYWAPEIAQDGGRFYVYYTARKKDGPLCVAVADADRPDGPYTDRGPLVCQELGSIDAAPIRDEKGRRYLVWKEDGNSRKQPTPLWAQPLSDDGLRLVGDKQAILKNEAPWEAHLVEGPYILRRGDWFYMFYSADACCGRACNYKLGVARSRTLLGTWERYPGNPILAGNAQWKWSWSRQHRLRFIRPDVPPLSRVRCLDVRVRRPPGPSRRGDVGRARLAGDQRWTRSVRVGSAAIGIRSTSNERFNRG